MERTIDLASARNNLEAIAADVQHSDPVFVKEPNGNDIVIMSADDYYALQETMDLIGIPDLAKAILENADTPLEQMSIYDPDENW